MCVCVCIISKDNSIKNGCAQLLSSFLTQLDIVHMQLKANKCTFWGTWHGIFLISPCLMYSEPVTLTLHLRAESTSYACNTHRPAARPQELKSIYSVFLAVPVLFFSSVFFCFLSFSPSFSSSKSHLWLPAERGVEKVNFSVGLYAMLGLSQSAPALALIRGDSLPDSSAQELSVKRPSWAL